MKTLLTYFQPTGGPILLFDTQPEESKSLLELKAKKRTAPPAPDPSAGANGATAEDINMADAAAPAAAGGAAAAAGVLTAVDEDEEGGEEAPVPDEFEVDDDEMEE